MKVDLNEIKEALKTATHGQEWTNFDDRENSNIVYEYDRLTESTCDIIAECKTIEISGLIANAPEWLASLVEQVEEMQKTQSQILKRVAEISPALAKSIIHEFGLEGDTT